MGKLGRDWTKLLAYLRIPDYKRPVIDDQQLTMREKIMRLLTEWRNSQEDKSTMRKVLAETLSRADHCLHEAVRILTHNLPQ